MSPHFERRLHCRYRPVRALACALVCSLPGAWSPADAQTIGDYSRAQRATIENTMMQAAARSAGLAASAPAVPATAAPAPVSPSPTTAASMSSRLVSDIDAAGLQVSGVFSSAADAVAEVAVNGIPYLLGAGQPVPGTAWRVDSVTVERVVLGRRESGGAHGSSEPAHRVFVLPSLR